VEQKLHWKCRTKRLRNFHVGVYNVRVVRAQITIKHNLLTFPHLNIYASQSPYFAVCMQYVARREANGTVKCMSVAVGGSLPLRKRNVLKILCLVVKTLPRHCYFSVLYEISVVFSIRETFPTFCCRFIVNSIISEWSFPSLFHKLFLNRSFDRCIYSTCLRWPKS